MFKRIELFQFQAYEESALDFCDGVNIILGLPNAGKTSIFRAIEWIVNNRPLGNRIHSNFAKTPETSVEIVLDNAEIRLTKWDKEREGYYLNGERFKKLGTDVPDIIKQAFALSNTNIQNQLDPHFLITSGPTDISRTINQIIGLDKAEEWGSTLTTNINSHTKEIDLINDDIISINLKLLRYTEIDEIDLLLIRAEKIEKLILEHSETIKELNKFLAEYIILEQKLNNAKKLLSAKNLIFSTENLLSSLQDKKNQISNLQLYLKFVDTIKIHKNFLYAASPPVENLFNLLSDLESIEQKILLLRKTLTKYEALIEAKRELTLSKRTFLKYLNEIGYCPVCNTKLDDDKIRKLVN